MTDLFIERGAHLSEDGRYRYMLWRRWDKTKPRLIFIMLNPSTADAEADDATIRLCMGRARRMGLGGIRVLNLVAFRATDPAQLDTVADPVGPENGRYLERNSGMQTREWYEPIIAAWGDGGLRKGLRRERWREALEILCGDYGIKLDCLGVTHAGQPKHPLRISYDVTPTRWMDRALYYSALRGEE
jgi:hypothetical protein